MYSEQEPVLLDLRFLIHNVFTYDRVVFFDFHFVWYVAFVFGRCVVMTSTSAGYEFNFILHDQDSCLDFFATGADISQNLIDTEFIDDA